MAARTPPPLGDPSRVGGPVEPRKATTISTIVVKAGQEAFLTVALLQSADFAHLRLDDMRPPLLAIGRNGQENARLSQIHEALLRKLREKEAECEALLSRAAALPREKNEDEAPVYAAMASSLDTTWRALLRRLHLREALLKDAGELFRLAGLHEELSRVSGGAIAALSTSQSPDGLARQIEVSTNELVSATEAAMALGVSLLGQIRILGQTSDGEKREQEILEAMLIVEAAMLRMADDFGSITDAWGIEKERRFGTVAAEAREKESEDVKKILYQIATWLGLAGRRLRASNEEGMRSLQGEAEDNRTRLVDIIGSSSDEAILARAGELAQGCEELIALTKASLGKGTRLRTFFVSAAHAISQMEGMARDMQSANEAMAGELAPLARQKATILTEEAEDILQKERLSHEERRHVTMKKNELMEKAAQLEALAEEKADTGKQLARDNLRRGREWLVREAEPWMGLHGDMGGTRHTATSFVEDHAKFAQSVIDRDEAIQFGLNEAARLSVEEQSAAREFEQRYSSLRHNLETRLNLGKTFAQVQEFATELESSFDSLEALIDQKAEHSERGVQQMSRVFEMIEETLGQERHQGERFISSAAAQQTVDKALKTTKASDTVREILVRHEKRFCAMADKWRAWQTNKVSSVQLSRVIEEIQTWQEETIEVIRLWEQHSAGRSVHENEEVQRRMETVRQELAQQNDRIQKSMSTSMDEQSSRRLEQTISRLREIEERLQKVQSKAVTEQEAVLVKTKQIEAARNDAQKTLEEVQTWQEEAVEVIRLWEAPPPPSVHTAVRSPEVESQLATVKRALPVQRARLEGVARIVEDEATTKKTVAVIEKQKEIEQRVDQFEQKRSAAAAEVRRTLEEIQHWHEEAAEVIRLWEAPPPASVHTAVRSQEVESQLATVKRALPVQRARLEGVARVVEDEETTKKTVATIQKQKEIEYKVDQFEQKRSAAVAEVRRTLEEIQQWQEETAEVIRLWEAPPPASVQSAVRGQEVESQLATVKRALPVQRARLEGVARVVEDEETTKKTVATIERHKEIEQRVDQFEQHRAAEVAEIRRTLEEIQLWQEDVVEIIRLFETARIQTTVEETLKKIETIKRDVAVQNETVERVGREVRDESTSQLVAAVRSKQLEIEKRMATVEQRVKEKAHLISQIRKVLEEIEVWQQDVVEVIRVWEAPRVRTRVEVAETLHAVDEAKKELIAKNETIERTTKEIEDEETTTQLKKIVERQREIAERLQRVHRVVEETVAEQVVEEVIKRPEIVTVLRDQTVEEGGRVDFVVKIDAKPEATVTWLKDGLDVEQTMDYRKSYNNGLATLSIEETFIEDSAVYTLKAKNAGGEAETSARLVVRSSSAVTEEGPRVVRGLKNTAVEEGEALHLDCVVVARPEPEVVWFKEETTLTEDERTRLEFRGDHCTLTVEPTKTTDSGVYTAKAKNVHGEATSFCQVKVSPKRAAPPPTPPKPERIPEVHVGVSRPPAMQCTLTNATYQPGMRAVLQVLVSGSPRPRIQWSIDEIPVKTDERVKVVEEESGWTRLVIESVQGEDAGLYMVVADNEMGEARTGATLHVHPGIGYETSSLKRRKASEESASEKTVTVLEKAPEKRTEVTTVTTTTTTTSAPQQTATVQFESFPGQTRTDLEEYSQRDEQIIQMQQRFNEMRMNGHVTTESPVPSHSRTEKSDIGLSNTSTHPDIIRGLQRDCTVNEGEELFLECLLVGNPRPKVTWYFNDEVIHKNNRVAEITQSGDSYSLRIKKAALENAGYYRLVIENVRGVTESLCVVHVRPAGLGPSPPLKKQHVTTQEMFAQFEYDQIRVDDSHSRIPTLKAAPTSPRQHIERQKESEYRENYELEERARVGNPPHFSQTLLSTVAADGQTAKFEGVVTGWPAPEVAWTKDDVPISRPSHPHLTFSNIGGRVSLAFPTAHIADSGKYKCTASNDWGVATSSAQLVVRPRTVAPDFVSRLISEEVAEGESLKWSVRVTGDPAPKVTWLRDGIVVPNCEEVRLMDEGNGLHSMVVVRVEMADSGQFTCLAENTAGEARSTADLVVRPAGSSPGHYFHVTKVTQEKQVGGQEVGGSRNETLAVESPIV